MASPVPAQAGEPRADPRDRILPAAPGSTVPTALAKRYFRFAPASCLNFASSSSFMKTVCSGPG